MAFRGSDWSFETCADLGGGMSLPMGPVSINLAKGYFRLLSPQKKPITFNYVMGTAGVGMADHPRVENWKKQLGPIGNVSGHFSRHITPSQGWVYVSDTMPRGQLSLHDFEG